jgi:hypothetical protein
MSKQSSVSVYRVCSESTDNMLMWICEVQYTVQGDGLGATVLFVEDDVKHRPRCIIWQHVRLERDTGENSGRS